MPQSGVMTRRMALGGALAGLLTGAAAAQQVNLTGSYQAQGRNPDGSAYDGQAVIGQQGNAVQVNWQVGNQTYAGSGILDGRVLVIDWGQPSPVVYVVMPNGELHGTWSEGRALERLRPR